MFDYGGDYLKILESFALEAKRRTDVWAEEMKLASERKQKNRLLIIASHDIDLSNDICRVCRYSVEEIWNQSMAGNIDIFTTCPKATNEPVLPKGTSLCECGGEKFGWGHSDWCRMYAP